MSKQLIDEYFQSAFGFTPADEDGRRVSYDDPRLAGMVLNMLRDSDPKIEAAFSELFARVMDRLLEGAPGLSEGSVELPVKASENMRNARQAHKIRADRITSARSNMEATMRMNLGI